MENITSMHFAFYFVALLALALLVAFVRTWNQLDNALAEAEHLRGEVALADQMSAELDAENARLGHQLRKLQKQAA